jgi:hypothetical protein
MNERTDFTGKDFDDAWKKQKELEKEQHRAERLKELEEEELRLQKAAKHRAEVAEEKQEIRELEHRIRALKYERLRKLGVDVQKAGQMSKSVGRIGIKTGRRLFHGVQKLAEEGRKREKTRSR